MSTSFEVATNISRHCNGQRERNQVSCWFKSASMIHKVLVDHLLLRIGHPRSSHARRRRLQVSSEASRPSGRILPPSTTTDWPVTMTLRSLIAWSWLSQISQTWRSFIDRIDRFTQRAFRRWVCRYKIVIVFDYF